MAVSGTISQTTFDTGRVIDAAFRRCRVPSQMITGEALQIARDALYLLLSSAGNAGSQLWTFDKQIIALTQGQAAYALPSGTLDLSASNGARLRTTSFAAGTLSTRLGGKLFTLTNAAAVMTASVTFSAGGTYQLIFETSVDDVTYMVGATIASATYAAGVTYWFDMDPAISGGYFCVRDAAAQSLSITTFQAGFNPYEIPLTRQSQDIYQSYPNKTLQSRPNSFWFDRQRDVPVMHIWPTPDAANASAQLVIARKRYIMDVGSLTQSLDIPQRWFDTIVSGLATRLCREIPDVKIELAPLLDSDYAKALALVQAEERDSSPLYIMPNIRAYTR